MKKIFTIIAAIVLLGAQYAAAFGYKSAADSWVAVDNNYALQEHFYMNGNDEANQWFVLITTNPTEGFNVTQNDDGDGQKLFVELNGASASANTIVRAVCKWDNGLYANPTVVLPEGKVWAQTGGAPVLMTNTGNYQFEAIVQYGTTVNIFGEDVVGSIIVAENDMPAGGAPSSLRLSLQNVPLVSSNSYVKIRYNLWQNSVTVETIDSEYCNTILKTGGEAARFTWETTAEGNIEISIASAIDGEVPGQTAFRELGWQNDRVEALTVDGVANTAYQFFTRTVTNDFPPGSPVAGQAGSSKIILTKAPTANIPYGAVIATNQIIEYRTSTGGNNLWPQINFTYTYGSNCDYMPDPITLAAPTNLNIDVANALTFEADQNAVKNTAVVFWGSVAVYEQDNFISGDIINYNTPGNYIIKIKSFGDGISYYNSEYSEGIEWSVAGDILPIGSSEFCHYYWNPTGAGANAGDADAVTVTVETQASGAITFTLNSVNGNTPAFRAAMGVENFRLGGSASANGNLYLTTQWTGNVCTVTPKAGVVIPAGMTLTYQGIIAYRTGDLADVNNLYPTVNWTYTYGTDCSNLVLTKLDPVENISVNDYGFITFDPVENAGSYNAFVYIGETLLYSLIPVASGEQLLFSLPGTFNVRVSANPSVENISVYQSSDLSEAFVWVISRNMPPAIPISAYCDYFVNPETGGNSVAGIADATLWSWNTNASNQLVISIKANDPAVQTDVAFRVNGMNPTNFTIDGVSAANLLEKVGDNLGNTQTFQAKNGFVLLPGLIINYSGQVEYRVLPLGSEGALDDLWPVLTFNEPYIFGSNCNGEVTVLLPPANITVEENTLTFDNVFGAVSYTVFIYNNDGEVIETLTEFVAGGSIDNLTIGRYTVKVQSIGNGVDCISSALSEAVELNVYGTLATPTVIRINTENKITFSQIENAYSYTVTVYQNIDDTDALITLTDFTNGSVIEMADNPYGTYFVRVQAIGDNDVILNSALSQPFEWDYQAPYVCNLLFSHPLTLGTEGNLAVYFAPNWAASANYTATVTDTEAEITLGEATFAEWQAQFHLVLASPILLKAAETYHLSVKVKTNQNTPLYCKVFDDNDDIYIELIARQNINSTEGAIFEIFDVVVPDGLNRISQLLFDFGGNAANANIQILDIVVCGDEAFRLAAPSNLSINGNELTFDNVDNAVAYSVYIFDDNDNQVYSIDNFVAGNEIDYTVPGRYNVKVKAVGDGIDYLDSELSEAAEWLLAGKLPKPEGLNIDAQNKLTFNSVASASSYVVTIYDAAASATAIVTLSDFLSGSVINIGSNPYGIYFVRVQAIGDGEILLDSDLSDACEWNFKAPTGINDINDNVLYIYPNPVSNILYINVDNNYDTEDIKLTDILGKVRDVELQNGSMNVSTLPNGIYLLNIGNKSVKFIKINR